MRTGRTTHNRANHIIENTRVTIHYLLVMIKTNSKKKITITVIAPGREYFYFSPHATIKDIEFISFFVIG
jgi:hypothetical protein